MLKLWYSFNSTRCIRNWSQAHYTIWQAIYFQLHTVHQEPAGGSLWEAWVIQTFNSTRCIRNVPRWLVPHAIGSFQLHTVHQERSSLKRSLISIQNFLSTPHGALGTMLLQSTGSTKAFFQLHTVHQEQLRSPSSTCVLAYLSFNSTRCIRNPEKLFSVICQTIFQLHTVHQGQKTIGGVGHGECLSTPHGALGTLSLCLILAQKALLSTPHGALGTLCNPHCTR